MRRDKVKQIHKYLQYLTIPSQKKEGYLSRGILLFCTYNQRGFLHSECVISNGLVYGAEDAQKYYTEGTCDKGDAGVVVATERCNGLFALADVHGLYYTEVVIERQHCIH